MIYLISHYNFNPQDPKPIHGPVHNVTSYLKKTGREYKALLLPLYSGPKAIANIFRNGKEKEFKIKRNLNYPLPVRSVLEFVLILKVGIRTRPEITIAVDPLNAFAAVFLKKLGFTKKLVYYTADYADDRFPSKVMNYIYHFLDTVSCNNSDYIWNVSSRILRRRLKMGVPKEKLVLLLNSPDSGLIKPGPKSKRHEDWIFTQAGTTHSFTFETSLKAFFRVAKEFPRAKMLIISGDQLKGDLTKKIKKLGIGENIIMMGPQTHDKFIELMKTCGIGVALYTNDYPWTKYGDSMKSREFMATGMPVIMTDNVSTSDDIKEANAGIIVEVDEMEIYRAMKKMLGNKKLYKKMSQNARRVAEETDFAFLLRESLAKIDA